MTGIARTLTDSEKSAVQLKADDISNAALSVNLQNKFVFFAAFGGTNNSEDFTFAGNSQSTAVREMFDLVTLGNPRSESVKVAYYAGVGTPPTMTGSSAIPTAQIIDTAEKAYTRFAVEAKQWRATHPDGEITSLMISFSRGAGSAAVFSQMLYARGLVAGDGEILIPPGQQGAISAALILDPVLTGIAGNMSFPETVHNLVVIRAEDEYRFPFRGAQYNDANIKTISVPGNHGDIGGFYDKGLSGLYLEAYHNFFDVSGLEVGDFNMARPYDPTKPVTVHSESIQSLGQALLNPWNAIVDIGQATTKSVPGHLFF